jgi:F1F0 ATPase subunit 2
METNEIFKLAGALTAGIISGILFFGGLWLTVKKGIGRQNPSLLFLGSFLLRMVLTVSIFYYVSGGSWQRLLTCAAGFFVARYLVLYFTKSPAEPHRETK